MNLSPQRQLPASLQRIRQALLGCYAGLLLYFAFSSYLALGGASLAWPVVWLLQTLPLLLFAPGLLQARPRPHAWFSFAILLYFCHAVLVAFDPGRRWLGVIEVLLCSAIFVLLILFIRQYRDHFQEAI